MALAGGNALPAGGNAPTAGGNAPTAGGNALHAGGDARLADGNGHENAKKGSAHAAAAAVAPHSGQRPGEARKS